MVGTLGRVRDPGPAAPKPCCTLVALSDLRDNIGEFGRPPSQLRALEVL